MSNTDPISSMFAGLADPASMPLDADALSMQGSSGSAGNPPLVNASLMSVYTRKSGKAPVKPAQTQEPAPAAARPPVEKPKAGTGSKKKRRGNISTAHKFLPPVDMNGQDETGKNKAKELPQGLPQSQTLYVKKTAPSEEQRHVEVSDRIFERHEAPLPDDIEPSDLQDIFARAFGESGALPDTAGGGAGMGQYYYGQPDTAAGGGGAPQYYYGQPDSQEVPAYGSAGGSDDPAAYSSGGLTLGADPLPLSGSQTSDFGAPSYLSATYGQDQSTDYYSMGNCGDYFPYGMPESSGYDDVLPLGRYDDGFIDQSETVLPTRVPSPRVLNVPVQPVEDNESSRHAAAQLNSLLNRFQQVYVDWCQSTRRN